MILETMKYITLRIYIVLFLAAAGFLSCAAPRSEEPPPAIQFTEHLIMDGYTYPFGIAAADLDGDGDLDLTSADALPHNDLYWFENDGAGSSPAASSRRTIPSVSSVTPWGTSTGTGIRTW